MTFFTFILLSAIVTTTTSGQSFHLTEAKDWEMFKFMFGLGFTTTSTILLMMSGLIVFMWKNLVNRQDKSDAINRDTIKNLYDKIDKADLKNSSQIEKLHNKIEQISKY